MSSVDPMFEVDAPKFYDFAHHDPNLSSGDSWFDRQDTGHADIVAQVNEEFEENFQQIPESLLLSEDEYAIESVSEQTYVANVVSEVQLVCQLAPASSTKVQEDEKREVGSKSSEMSDEHSEAQKSVGPKTPTLSAAPNEPNCTSTPKSKAQKKAMVEKKPSAAKPPRANNIDKPKQRPKKFTTPKPFQFHQTTHHRPGDRSLTHVDNSGLSKSYQKQEKPKLVKSRSSSLHNLDRQARKRSLSHGDLPISKTLVQQLSKSPSLSALNKKDKSDTEHSSHPLRRHGSRPNLRIGPTSGTTRPHPQGITRTKEFEFSTDKLLMARKVRSVEPTSKQESTEQTSDSKSETQRNHIRRSTKPKCFNFQTEQRANHRREQSVERAQKDKDTGEERKKQGGHVSRSQGFELATEKRSRERSRSIDRNAKKTTTTAERKPFLAVQPRTFKIQPQPFKFDQRDKQKLKERAHWLKEERQKNNENQKPIPFRARPVKCDLGPSKKVLPLTMQGQQQKVKEGTAADIENGEVAEVQK